MGIDGVQPCPSEPRLLQVESAYDPPEGTPQPKGSRCSKCGTTRERGVAGSSQALFDRHATSYAVTRRIAESCGVNIPPEGFWFEFNHPRTGEEFQARLGRTSRGCLVIHNYQDWPYKRPYVRIPDLYAAHVRGKYEFLTGPRPIQWYYRALVELGIVEAPQIDARPASQVPTKHGRKTRAVYEGFLLYIQVEMLMGLEGPYRFSIRFAEEWCGVTRGTAMVGLRWLVQNGFIETAGSYGRGLHEGPLYSLKKATAASAPPSPARVFLYVQAKAGTKICADERKRRPPTR